MKQHISGSSKCDLAQKKLLVATRSLPTKSQQEAAQSIDNQQQFKMTTRRFSWVRKREDENADSCACPSNPAALLMHPDALEMPNSDSMASDPEAIDHDLDKDIDDQGDKDNKSVSAASLATPVPSDSDEDSLDSSAEDKNQDKMLPMNSMLNGFKDHCSQQTTPHVRFSRAEETSICLLPTLKRKKTALNAHPELLEWHLKETKHLQQHETLKDTNECVHRNTPLKRLMKRHNLEAMMPKMKAFDTVLF